MFFINFNIELDFICKEFDFYNWDYLIIFGWYKDKFVYFVEDYDKFSIVDGELIFIWCLGVKYDCLKVMEFE